MTTSRIAWMGTMLTLAALLPVNCRDPISEKTTSTPEIGGSQSGPLAGEVTDEPLAGKVSDTEKQATPETSADSATTTKSIEPWWRTANRVAREGIQRTRRNRAEADWRIALRIDAPTIVPCQPVYVTIKLTNTTDQARQLDELLASSKIWMLVGRYGEQPRVVSTAGVETDIGCGPFAGDQKRIVPAKASVFFDRMLTIERVDGSHNNNPAPPRIFNEPGKYNVYAAVVDQFIGPGPFEVLRSDPLALTVREPTESEVPYMEFFRDGRQIPPHYGFSRVDEVAFEKVRGQGQRTATFRRKVNAEAIEKLRAMLAKHPDPPVADEMRHYLMALLIQAAKKYDEQGRDQGDDREVLAAAAQQYLDIAPERKQLRRRGINTWGDLSTRFDLDHSQPNLQILASWKASSPFYEDEAESQAALDEIIAKIEAPLAQEARQKAAALPPKSKVPTD
jgi:hypothetical protein